MIKKLYVNVSFTGVLSQMLTYLIPQGNPLQKEELEEHEITTMPTTTSVVIESMPQKLKDPVIF